ncbi:MAG: hypothetical protein M3082_20215, partial [Candidatus Dormibacteraeota bacterium]|nr:hypothetical protein [Candidatus Dormibacteraeota bacterium]
WKMVAGSTHHHLVTVVQIVEVAGLLVTLLGIQLVSGTQTIEHRLTRGRSVVLQPAYVLALASVFTFFFAIAHTAQRFIYFQF